MLAAAGEVEELAVGSHGESGVGRPAAGVAAEDALVGVHGAAAGAQRRGQHVVLAGLGMPMLASCTLPEVAIRSVWPPS